MVKEIELNGIYRATVNYDGLQKGHKYILIGQTRLRDSRGWSYDDYILKFVNLDTNKEVEATNVEPKMLTKVKIKRS